MGAWSASTRFRAIQHLPRLQARLGNVDLLLPRDEVARRPHRAGQVRFFAVHAQRYLERAREVRAVARRYDALFVQRGLYVLGPGAIVGPLERFDGRLVFDLDDAVFELRPPLDRKGPAARWLWGAQQSLRLLRRADAVVVSTVALAEMLPARSPEPIVLPTVPDPSRYATRPARERRPITVGWTGSIQGLRYLEPLRHAFMSLARDGVATLEVVSAEPWRGPARFVRWRQDTATSIFHDFDVGIMPLDDTPYTRAKAGFKLLEYMAAGLPVVASPVGVNAQLVRSSGAGMLADTPADWEQALRALAADPDLRRQLGARGREFVEGYADLDAQAGVLAGLLCP